MSTRLMSLTLRQARQRLNTRVRGFHEDMHASYVGQAEPLYRCQRAPSGRVGAQACRTSAALVRLLRRHRRAGIPRTAIARRSGMPVTTGTRTLILHHLHQRRPRPSGQLPLLMPTVACSDDVVLVHCGAWRSPGGTVARELFLRWRRCWSPPQRYLRCFRQWCGFTARGAALLIALLPRWRCSQYQPDQDAAQVGWAAAQSDI